MRRFRQAFPEGDVAGVEFGDPARPLAMLFLHATGFNAMTYQSMLAPLGLRAHVAALDLRGHGRTTLPANPRKLGSWTRYRDDVIAWLDRNAPQGVVLSGHSMGGCVATLVAGKRPDLVRGLVLVDPVILAPRFYFWLHVFPPLAIGIRGGNKLARGARRRRASFASIEAAKAKYQGRGAFTTWREPFLDDYLLDALERVDDNPADSEDQTWSLLCEPRWEAATFNAQRNRPWQGLARAKRHSIPITLLRADTGSVVSDREAARMVRRNRDMVLKQKRGTSHFLPMEAPYDVREELSSYISGLVEGFSSADAPHIRRTLATEDRY